MISHTSLAFALLTFLCAYATPATATRMKRLQLPFQLSGSPTDCGDTKEEHEAAVYVASRERMVSDGTIAAWISSGTYTPDSLLIEMYHWWVQLGLANHGAAIDSFVDMITDAGTPQQVAASKDWVSIVWSWAGALAGVAGNTSLPGGNAVKHLYDIVDLGVVSWKNGALIAADPKQGGSTDFLKAAQRWRRNLPGRHTRQLNIVFDFISCLRSGDSQELLLPAYKLVTQLISATPSYRYLFNMYYATYLRSSVPNNDFFFMSLVKPRGTWGDMGSVTNKALWTPAPVGLSGCVIEKAVMETNDLCVNPLTPVLGTFGFKALMQFDHGYSLAFSCDDVDYDAYIGGFDISGQWFERNEVTRAFHGVFKVETNLTNLSHPVSRVWNLWKDKPETNGALSALQSACEHYFTPTTDIAAFAWSTTLDHNCRHTGDKGLTVDHCGQRHPVSQLRSEKSLNKYTCPAAV